MDQPTHENHENWCAMIKSDFTITNKCDDWMIDSQLLNVQQAVCQLYSGWEQAR